MTKITINRQLNIGILTTQARAERSFGWEEIRSSTLKKMPINWAKVPFVRFIDAQTKHLIKHSLNIKPIIAEIKCEKQLKTFNQIFSLILSQELKINRGFRQKNGYPSNGQRTKTNAKTSKQMLHYIQLLQKYSIHLNIDK